MSETTTVFRSYYDPVPTPRAPSTPWGLELQRRALKRTQELRNRAKYPNAFPPPRPVEYKEPKTIFQSGPFGTSYRVSAKDARIGARDLYLIGINEELVTKAVSEFSAFGDIACFEGPSKCGRPNVMRIRYKNADSVTRALERPIISLETVVISLRKGPLKLDQIYEMGSKPGPIRPMSRKRKRPEPIDEDEGFFDAQKYWEGVTNLAKRVKLAVTGLVKEIISTAPVVTDDYVTHIAQEIPPWARALRPDELGPPGLSCSPKKATDSPKQPSKNTPQTTSITASQSSHKTTPNLTSSATASSPGRFSGINMQGVNKSTDSDSGIEIQSN